MPDPNPPINLTISIVDGAIKVSDPAAECDPGDEIVWTADKSVNRWVIGFTEADKFPFTGNEQFFTGVDGSSDCGKVRNADPDDYKYWIFCEGMEAGQHIVVFDDPKIVIRVRSVGPLSEGLRQYAGHLGRLLDQMSTVSTTAEELRWQALSLARQFEENSGGERGA